MPFEAEARQLADTPVMGFLDYIRDVINTAITSAKSSVRLRLSKHSLEPLPP